MKTLRDGSIHEEKITFLSEAEIFYNQVAVAVKTLRDGSTHEDKISFLSEAEMMKRFEHKVTY